MRVGVLLAFLTFLPFLGEAPGTAQQEIKRGEPFCYAFLKGDASIGHDLYINCGAGKERITTGKDVWDFAVATDASALALWRQRGTQQLFRLGEKGLRPSSVGPRMEIEVVSLDPHFHRRWSGLGDGPTVMDASCGTILATENDIRLLPSGRFSKTRTTYDVLSGKVLSYEPYQTFLCSSDSKVIVGNVGTDLRVLMAGWPPQRQIVEAPANNIVYVYAISPNGQYVAYVAEDLCVEDHGRTLGCTGPSGTLPRRVSVSNSMDVLMDGGTGQTQRCFLDASRRKVSFEPLPGYEEEECLGVAYWRPGNKAAQVLEMFGTNPQWITPEAAAALRAWRSHEKSSGGSK
jgi:hypothetical protein